MLKQIIFLAKVKLTWLVHILQRSVAGGGDDSSSIPLRPPVCQADSIFYLLPKDDSL